MPLRYTRETYERPMLPDCAEEYTRWILNIDGSHGEWANTPAARMFWRGHRAIKTPADQWVYQEILWELRPQLVVEFGTYDGGSALFLADILELVGQPARVITVDRERHANVPEHPRLTYVVEDSRNPEVQRIIGDAARQCSGPVLLIHDSDHTYEQVAADLEHYCRYVTPGSYFIVEDAYPHVGRWTDATWETSPARAVMDFLNQHPEFEIDWSREKFATTTIHGGYLQRSNP